MSPLMKLALSRKNLWDRLPRPLKSGIGAAIGQLPADVILGRAFREHLRFVREAQWWPAERARDHQLASLRRLCMLAYTATPFYRRAFDRCGLHPADLRAPEELSALPTIDQNTVREHLDEMRIPGAARADYVSTGGTGGSPLQFYIGADRSAIEYAYLVAGWQRAGYRLGMPVAVFRGRAVKPNGGGLRHEHDPLLRHHYYSNFHMGDEDMRAYLRHVARIGPCFLHVYPSSVYTLARYLLRSGEPAPENVQGILAESEIVYPEQRQIVEKVFHRRYFSSYGHTEKTVAAAECESSTDYHVWPTYGYFELLDETGRPVREPGLQGEIVGTGFINTVVPFIRYRTGDYAVYRGERCPACGREQPVISDIRGHRTQESLLAADGSEISWTALNMHDDTFERVRQFQFVQTQPGSAVLRVVPAAGFGESERRRIESRLEPKLDGRVRFTIELVDQIPLSGRGKALYVDRRNCPARA